MPSVTVTLAGDIVELYTCQHGRTDRPTRLTARTAESETATVWASRTNDVTVGGTSAVTDGIPTYQGEVFSDEMLRGDAWYVTADENGTVIYYSVNGSI